MAIRFRSGRGHGRRRVPPAPVRCALRGACSSREASWSSAAATYRKGSIVVDGARYTIRCMVDLDFLETIQIFRIFSRPELEAAEPLLKEVSYAKDDVVIRIGDPGDVFYVVL